MAEIVLDANVLVGYLDANDNQHRHHQPGCGFGNRQSPFPITEPLRAFPQKSCRNDHFVAALYGPARTGKIAWRG